MRSGAAPTRRTTCERRAFLVAVLIALAAGDVADAGERVEIEVATVLATNSGEHFDSQLTGMRRKLEKLPRYASYTSYQLVKREFRDVDCGDPVDVEIPGGRLLRVVPKSVGGDRVSLNVMLRQDSRAVVRTDITLGPAGTVLVGGPRHGGGVLIIWIGAQPVASTP